MRIVHVLLLALLLSSAALAQEADGGSVFRGALTVFEPESIAGTDSAGVALFGDTVLIRTTGITGLLAAAEPFQACMPLSNPGAVAGRIAIILRGECPFETKAIHAEQAGAIGFLVFNHDPTNQQGTHGLLNMAPGDASNATIGGLFISYARGTDLINALAFGDVRVRLFNKHGVATEPTAPEAPGSHALSSAFPNPFNPEAHFTISVARPQHVTLTLHDVLGRRIATLFEGMMAADRPQRFTIDGTGWPSGTYFYRAAGDHFSETRTVTLLR
jgi:hypothetical protein